MHRILKALLTGFIGFLLFAFMLETAIAATGDLEKNGFSINYSTTGEQVKIDPNVDANDNGSYSQTETGSMVTISATSATKKVVNLWITKLTYYAANYKNTLTITNTTNKVLKLSYTVSGMDSGNGNYEDIILQPGANLIFSVTTTVSSKDSTTSQTKSGTFTITDICEVAGINVSFASSAHGSYSYTLGNVSNTVQAGDGNSDLYSTSVGSVVCLTVGEVEKNYTFYGWMASGVLLGKSNAEAEYALSEDSVVYPIFLPTDMIAKGEPYKVGQNYYMFWNDAFSDAMSSRNTVVVTRAHTLTDDLESNGLCEGFAEANYIYRENGKMQFVVPFGTTFLIPFDDGYTLYTGTPGYSESYTQPSYYLTLTMNGGTNIYVKGAMSLSGKHCSDMGENGAPVGPVAHVQMSDNSSIVVAGGGNLYAWGFITGAGTVTVESGGSVYEDFQVTDWRGGAATKSMNDNSQRVFPVSQYYIQNIEVPLVLNAGAQEYVCMTVEISKMIRTVLVQFIGDSDDAVMFRIKSGSMTKYYDGTTDRQHFVIDGTVELYYFSVTIPGMLGIADTTLNTANYYMPLNGNITVTVKEKATISVLKDLVLLPGVVIDVNQKATISLGSGSKVVVYDADQWGAYCYSNSLIVPIKYAPGQTCAKRSASSVADLLDAKIIVNGTLDASQGQLFVTAGGSDICSTGEGRVVVGAAGTKPTYYQATQSGTSVSFSEIPIVHAKLKNADGTYVIPKNVFQGVVEYKYVNGKWQGVLKVYKNDTFEDDSLGILKQYRLENYLWLNASGYVNFADGRQGSLFVTSGDSTNEYKLSDGTYTKNDGVQIVMVGDAIYLVKKIVAKEIPDSVTFTITYSEETDNVKYTYVSETFEVKLTDAKYTQEEINALEGDAKTQAERTNALINKLDPYGVAAKDYFGEQKLVGDSKPGVALGLITPSDKQVAQAMDGVGISTTGAAFYFDEALRLSVGYNLAGNFAVTKAEKQGDPDIVTIEIDGEQYTVAQVGMLVQRLDEWNMANLVLTADPDKCPDAIAYIVYNATTDKTVSSGGADNRPNDSIAGESAVSVATFATEGRITFDMKMQEYTSCFAIRTYVVLQKTTGESVEYICLYGNQYGYGLEAYIKATYDVNASTSADKSFNNLLIQTWALAQEAAK